MTTRNDGPRTLSEAIRYFADADVALQFMVELRWPDGEVSCPTCGSKAVRFMASRRLWQCGGDHSRRQFSIKVGTVMEDSPLGLDKWATAMWLIANCKNGISSYELHRALGITQKSAWFVLHRVRLAMQRGSMTKIDGEVEVDETYVGGKARFMHPEKKGRKIKGRGTAGKIAVFGLLSRHGNGKSKIQAHVIDRPDQATLQGHIRAAVEPGSTIYSDEHSGYRGLHTAYAHKVVNHAETYVKGKIHTQGIENFWSLLKRGIRGTYVSVEPFHLYRYVDEQAFRFNERKNEAGDAGRFMEVLRTIVGKRLTYKQLIGEDEPLRGMVPATT